MDEILKQRIVGTIVITSIAAIFIPMLFDDPIEGADSYSNELVIPEESLSTLQHQMNTLPTSRDAVLSRPLPEHVNLQTQKITKAIKKDDTLKSWVIQIGSFSQKANAVEFKESTF